MVNLVTATSGLSALSLLVTELSKYLIYEKRMNNGF